MQELRFIPSIEQLRQRPAVRALEQRYGLGVIVEALRAEAATLRTDLLASGSGGGDGEPVASAAEATERIERGLTHRLSRTFAPSLRSVLNATGVILHTNLGRAPLSAAAVDRLATIATGYTNLEYDLTRGGRGSRHRHAESLLCRLSGAEAATVVNNNAAATLLVLASLAAGREVIISRGELVEIGGGFRVPDVMAQSGAVLREVGTTNRTRVADYAAAIGERTALILRVHPSNFRIEGFAERPQLTELASVGRRFGVPVAEDLGSGNLTDWSVHADTVRISEPTVHASVRAGAEVVCFSGDKLLGGPQAGIIVGRRDAIERVRTHPLMRAVRAGKLTYAALEATLLDHVTGRAHDTVPVLRMAAASAVSIEERLGTLTTRLGQARGLRVEIVNGESTIGGGSAPGTTLPTRLLALTVEGERAEGTEVRLRALDPPVITRIETDRVVLDLRTVLPQQDAVLTELLLRLARAS